MRILWQIAALGLAACAWAAQSDVRVWQETLSLPTYEERGLPDSEGANRARR